MPPISIFCAYIISLASLPKFINCGGSKNMKKKHLKKIRRQQEKSIRKLRKACKRVEKFAKVYHTIEHRVCFLHEYGILSDKDYKTIMKSLNCKQLPNSKGLDGDFDGDTVSPNNNPTITYEPLKLVDPIIESTHTNVVEHIDKTSMYLTRPITTEIGNSKIVKVCKKYL